VKIPEIHVGWALPTKPLDKSKKICSGDAPQEEKCVSFKLSVHLFAAIAADSSKGLD